MEFILVPCYRCLPGVFFVSSKISFWKSYRSSVWKTSNFSLWTSSRSYFWDLSWSPIWESIRRFLGTLLQFLVENSIEFLPAILFENTQTFLGEIPRYNCWSYSLEEIPSKTRGKVSYFLKNVKAESFERICRNLQKAFVKKSSEGTSGEKFSWTQQNF